MASLAATAGLAVTVYAVWLVYRYGRLYEFSDAGGLISKHDSYVWAAGALLSVCGYVGLALTFDARTALQKGGTALWASAALVLLVFIVPIVNKEDWTGASFLMLLFLIFCYPVFQFALMFRSWNRAHAIRSRPTMRNVTP